MDNIVRVRFFRPVPIVAGSASLTVALQDAFDRSTSARDREIEVFPGVVVRIERLRRRDGFTDAEIVRVQRGNIPPEARDDGLVPLTIGGLGHSTVISYNDALDVMAVQVNHQMSIGRAMDYLAKVNRANGYRADPLVQRDAWERYNRGRPRKLRLVIANPENLPAVEGQVGALSDMSRRLAEMADAPMITMEIGMGSRGGSLSKNFIDGVLQFFTNGEGREHDVRQMRVTTTSDEGGGGAIDFLDDVLQSKTTLDLPPTDTEAHFERRRSYVGACFEEHIEYIREVYGRRE